MNDSKPVRIHGPTHQDLVRKRRELYDSRQLYGPGDALPSLSAVVDHLIAYHDAHERAKD